MLSYSGTRARPIPSPPRYVRIRGSTIGPLHEEIKRLVTKESRCVCNKSFLPGKSETDLKEFLDRLIEKKILSVKSGVYEVI